ncbi:hypothetical protein BO70DRAFT_424799 [Aspergillus heteromorphus CBS 117.55]|uniref:Uncharacterized protein n=1 Tax=Aspergillus heteromorphus CBS 117.55 TaxID=1448321 RepID=A0A317X3E9_9EURO|nr:uncharacterized protein BO70DRAFT_424799 [Aspergillus heteromorphus CBS 117.55]PWY92027.1 hypothetical protein BO70DRAFT_424799 [Aspergillus heteromorphus CBS 117.55]
MYACMTVRVTSRPFASLGNMPLQAHFHANGRLVIPIDWREQGHWEAQFNPPTMCSQYYLRFDCKCVVLHNGVVACSKKGTPDCHGVKDEVRDQKGYNCPKHGG